MRKILVVEDSQTIRKAIEIALKAEDYHIAFCSKSEDVLPLVNEIIPNAILVDIRMDEKSGYDICKELKEQETVGKLPVILIGAEEFFEEAKARECDYDGFITKPFLTEELIKSLDVIIKRSHKLFPEIQEISERQTIAPSEPYTMPVAPAEIPSGSIDTTEGAPTREMINQIESDTRDSAVAYQDLFDTDARSITAETQAPSEQEEIKQEESSPEEVIEPQENYGEIAESPAHEDRDEQEVADEVPHEKENTEDLPPENVEPVDNEDAEIDDDEVIRQIDTFTSDDYDDEVSEVKIKKEEV